MTHHTTTPIDPHRPWIRDERDDPSRMNWVQTLFNPFGMTGKLHFSRAWTFMFMGRLLLFIVPVFGVSIATMAGADLSSAWQPIKSIGVPLPALLVPFFFFTIVTEFTSWVAHVRRFAEANRSTLKAAIVLIPLTLGLIGFALGVMGGVSQYEAQQGQSAQAPVETVTDETADGAAADAAPTEAAEQAPAQNRGRRGPPPTPAEMALGAGMGLAMPLWALSSFFVMLWTLLHVARLPNGGVGGFRTGSDLTQEEQRLKSYEMAASGS
ncbi:MULTISPECIES: hypothetical protein [Hyphomonas]|uniref:DUF805 domain-containing protein n=3 Tax=Hyphomonas atlantica TaxID=1280948 RepID=A0A059E215_9PROT|nr:MULTISPECIES: hypothetical protein [Hyphomonas]KCZ61635.1 hypothetical protein HY36_03565 [Hyphomonas atlantica]MAM05914.1 hypothetical protein [Hyphomonas sp.]|tara:strand:- start:746 stop:1546 length:801 start_codon:yes stop_codon:yes gene_type:complete